MRQNIRLKYLFPGINGGCQARRKNSGGMTLVEVLVVIAIVLILNALAVLQTRGLIQRAKVSTAKATVKVLALSLGMIKDDTAFYPTSLADIKKAKAPGGLSSSRWRGPYGETISLIDPWGNPYFYKLDLEEEVVFGPATFLRSPKTKTVDFTSFPGHGTLIIDNHGITAGRIWLNGEEVVSPNEFKKHVKTIRKSITLSSDNTLDIKLTNEKNKHIVFRITKPVQQTKDTTFTLGSYGRDGKEGGTGYQADILYGEF